MIRNRMFYRELCALVGAVMSVAGMFVGAGPARASGCGANLAPLQSLPGCNLNRATLGASLSLADSDLSGANLNHATVSGHAALLGSNLKGANLNGATISDLDALINAEAAGANLNHAQVTGNAVGVGADLTGANLNGATIAGLGDLTGANLAGADLNHAIVSGTGAFTGANLIGANLTGVTVSGFDAFFDANLIGANLRGAATSRRSDAFSGATWSHTTCPDGTNSDRDLGTCAGHLNGPPAVAHVLPLGVVVGGGGCSPPGTASQLVFMSSPSSAVADTSFLVSLAVKDANGCIESADTSTSVRLALGTAPTSGGGLSAAVGSNGPAGAISCTTNPVTVFDGIADFNCSIATAGTGYTVSATAASSGGTILEPATSAPFDVSAASTPPPGTVLGGGGLNLDAYCGGYSHVPGVGRPIANGGTNSEFGPNYAFAWYCVNAAGTSGSPISIQAACDHEYGPGAVAYLGDPNDAYTWSCVTLAGATSTSTFTAANGGYYGTRPDGTTLLAGGAFGGGGGLPDFVYLGPAGDLVADGGLGGGGSLPDIVDSSSDGSAITYSTPAGGFDVAESGSLATGGAV